MWVLTDKGFISVVQRYDDPATLLVRARVKEDILGLFPEAEVLDVPGCDYEFRSDIRRREVAEVLAEKVMMLDYSSHAKDIALERSAPNPARHRAYYSSWSAMAAMQPCAPYSTTPRPTHASWWDEGNPEEDDFL